MRELIESKGFKLKSSCSCGGTFRQTFKSNSAKYTGVEIILFPNRKGFEIRKHYKRIVKGKDVELEKILKENGLD